MSRRWFFITLVFLIAIGLRLALLADIPPGMTHDEADHGLDAWGVVNGIRPIYFTVGYGREPFFDYATAILMSFMGPTYFAGRLISGFFSLILLAATYGWTKKAFNHRTALISSAGLAIGFWAVMTGRHALRSVTMPALFTLAMVAFWMALRHAKPHKQWQYSVVSGLLLGVSFYTYLPARIMWFILPCLLVVWLIFDRPMLQKMWRQTILVLLIAFVIGSPLFYHLATTEAEVRIDQLSGPLDAAREGDFSELIANTRGSLRLFTQEGDSGDVIWRYNIPGRPLLGSVMGLLFHIGWLIALGKIVMGPNRRTRWTHAFVLMWLIGGLAPSLITGPEASTTRAIAMQPVLYLFPAITLNAVWALFEKWHLPLDRMAPYATAAVLLLFGFSLADTSQTYFIEWANHPDVRVHYETTRVTTMDYLNQNGSGTVAVSSPRPDRFHDPSTALMTLDNENVSLRWFNGQHSLLLPQSAENTLIFSGWASLAEPLQAYFPITASDSIAMEATDLDRPIEVFETDTVILADQIISAMGGSVSPTQFGDNATLLGYQTEQHQGVLHIITLWRSEQSIEGLKLFTHLLAEPGTPPVAQADRLDVPSYYWVSGDIFLQLHTLFLPNDLASGTYTLTVGAYTQPDPETFLRLPVQGGGDSIILEEIALP